jgi:hypothetical protein
VAKLPYVELAVLVLELEQMLDRLNS